MQKTKAIQLLGGNTGAAAAAVGCSYQAVNKWPDELPPRIADRVLAVLARKHLPQALLDDLVAAPSASDTAPLVDGLA